YPFPWQARAFFVPRGTPNTVATVFGGQALCDLFERTGDEGLLAAAQASCRFLCEHLVLMEDGQRLCFGYVPGEGTRVHNANLLAASLLGRVHRLTGDTGLLTRSAKAVRYSMEHLDPEGDWPYGERHHHRFVDSFHTGFNLVAVHSWSRDTGDHTWLAALDRAWHRYWSVFWLPDGAPRYYRHRTYPLDIHASAQGIVTGVRLADRHPAGLERAAWVASWAIRHFQSPAGSFACRRTRWGTVRIPYLRWAQAWMHYGLSLLASAP
ncbi:MAG: hypothetical protein AB1634_17145, partial [Thermodesulfobacteriota bacterium]